jgi:endothelial-specific receptor tyrosine kinase
VFLPGGTPYSDVGTKELPARVMRGLILPQARHVGDDLYQLMLQCWQVDLDERPTFGEICQILEDLMQNPLVRVTLN